MIVGEHMPVSIEDRTGPGAFLGRFEHEKVVGADGLGRDVHDAAIALLVDTDIDPLVGRKFFVAQRSQRRRRGQGPDVGNAPGGRIVENRRRRLPLATPAESSIGPGEI